MNVYGREWMYTVENECKWIWTDVNEWEEDECKLLFMKVNDREWK